MAGSRHLRTRASKTGLVALLIGLTALVVGVLPAAGATAGGQAGDWTTYGYDLQRTGHNPVENQLTARNADQLREHWSVRLDGVSDTSPVVASGVRIGGRSTRVVYVGSEHGTLYAVNAQSGQVLWTRFLGKEQTRCSDLPGGVFGITDTPVIDESANLIYAVGGTGLLYALDLATGKVAPGYPLRVVENPAKLHVWSALTLWGNRLYAATASYCDFRPYHGHLILVDVTAPRVVTSFCPTGRNGPDGGAIWG